VTSNSCSFVLHVFILLPLKITSQHLEVNGLKLGRLADTHERHDTTVLAVRCTYDSLNSVKNNL
jgi:hypothetical protein